MKKTRLVFASFATLVLSLIAPAQLVFAALSPADYIGQGIDHYGENDAVCGGKGSLSGSTNEEKVLNWLMGKELSVAQASGIMGNMQAESSFNPFRMQSMTDINTVLPTEQHGEYNRAFGLVQWDGGRRQQILTRIASKFPSYITDINSYGATADGNKNAGATNDNYLSFELDYIFEELSGPYKAALDGIKAQPNDESGAREASMIWDRKYEISDGSGARADKAAAIYNNFKDKQLTSSTASANCGNPAGNVVWYSQMDPQWANNEYAGGTIGAVGCGPTSMAIILATLYDKNITPAQVAAVATADQGNAQMTMFQPMIKDVNAKWNTNISGAPVSIDEAVSYLQSGKGFIWAGGTGAAPFTKSGHMVAFVGVTSDGQITVADPYGDGPGHQHIANYPKSQISATVGSMFEVPKP